MWQGTREHQHHWLKTNFTSIKFSGLFIDQILFYSQMDFLFVFFLKIHEHLSQPPFLPAVVEVLFLNDVIIPLSWQHTTSSQMERSLFPLASFMVWNHPPRLTSPTYQTYLQWHAPAGSALQTSQVLLHLCAFP